MLSPCCIFFVRILFWVHAFTLQKQPEQPEQLPVYYIKVSLTNQEGVQLPLYGPDPLSVSEGTDLRIECTTDDTDNIERNMYQYYVKFPNTQPIPLYQYSGMQSFIILKDCLKNSAGIYSCTVMSDEHSTKIHSITKKINIEEDFLKIWGLNIKELPKSKLIQEFFMIPIKNFRWTRNSM